MKITNITLGADPELFLIDENNNPISAEGLIGGSKKRPKLLSEQGHAVQEDNVMVEFNIPPVIDSKSFNREITNTIGLIYSILPSNLSLKVASSMEFPETVLNTKQASTFGCSIDFNVWTNNMMPIISPDTNYRFAGGHIHVGWDNNNMSVSEELIKAMDLFLGIPSIILDDGELRKKVYGKAGRFRFTKYGIEYRTLSNFWLSSEKLTLWVAEQTMNAINFVNQNNTISNDLGERIQKAINTNNKELSINIIKECNLNIEIQKYEPQRKVKNII